MAVAEEIFVVGKHQQQITRPQYHIHLHKCYQRCVACYWFYLDTRLAFFEEYLLQIVEKIATALDAKQIQEHKHNPESYGRR